MSDTEGPSVEAGDGTWQPAAEPAEDEPALGAALEAILLVVDEPVADEVLARVLEQPATRVSAALYALSEEYTAAGRGFDLRRAAGGWRLYTRAEYAPYVERFVLDGQQARLSQAALETLAVVAYKQPVTRSRVSAIRGVNCDGVIRTLLTRGLVEEDGTEPESGAHLYRTTGTFLEKLGLDSLAQLPPLAPFLPDDVDALDPDARDLPDLPGEAVATSQAEPGVAETEAEPGVAAVVAEPAAAETEVDGDEPGVAETEAEPVAAADEVEPMAAIAEPVEAAAGGATPEVDRAIG